MTLTATLTRLVQLDSRKRAVLIEALVALTAASAAIRLMPFRRVVRFGSGRKRENKSPDPAAQALDLRQARWAVEAVANRVPWKAVCFQRGLALHWMLRRRGMPSLLHYGVAQAAEKELSAHVWLSCDGSVVLGGEEADRFACLATFPASAS